jgi:hypothetical protein
MIGDDEVEAEDFGGLGSGEGADAGIDTNDQAHAFAGGGFEDLALHSVALAQAMRNVEANGAAKALDGGLEQDYGGGSVDVIVAVYEDDFARGDRLLDASDGGGHAEHEIGIVQVIEARAKEARGFGAVADASRDEQARDQRREPERLSRCGLRFAENPALRGAKG